MKYVLITGRILFSLPFLINGIGHFMKTDAIAGMVPEYFPQAHVWAIITGIALVLAAISIITTKMVRMAGLLLGVMLIIFALTIHLPLALSGNAEMSMMGTTNLLKDLGLAGGAFILSAFYNDRI